MSVANTSFLKTPGHHSKETILQECFNFSLRTDTGEFEEELFSGHQRWAFFSPAEAAEALGASIETPALSKSCGSGAVVFHAQRRLAHVALDGVIIATSFKILLLLLLLLPKLLKPLSIGLSCHMAIFPIVSLTRIPSN